MGPLRRAALRVPPVRRLAARRGADRPYRRLLTNGQVRPLDRRELAVIDEYARDVLGDAAFAPGLRLFAAVNGGFRTGWIPDSYFGARVMPRVSTAVARRLGPVRTMMTALLGTDGVPEVGNRIAGRWYDRDRRPTSRAAVAAAAAAHGPTLVVKLDGSLASRGVRVLPVAALADSEPDPGTDLTVQHLVAPHPDLGALSPGSTPPLRLMTVLVDGRPELFAAHLRLGTGVLPVAGGAEALRVAVSLEGVVGDRGADASWRLHERHPVTGGEFAGLRVPSFSDAVARCLAWHRLLPHAGVVGWDVAVDSAGAVHLLEWNTFWPGVVYHEALSGPNFTHLGWERFAPHAGSDGTLRRTPRP